MRKKFRYEKCDADGRLAVYHVGGDSNEFDISSFDARQCIMDNIDIIISDAVGMPGFMYYVLTGQQIPMHKGTILDRFKAVCMEQPFVDIFHRLCCHILEQPKLCIDRNPNVHDSFFNAMDAFESINATTVSRGTSRVVRMICAMDNTIICRYYHRQFLRRMLQVIFASPWCTGISHVYQIPPGVMLIFGVLSTSAWARYTEKFKTAVTLDANAPVREAEQHFIHTLNTYTGDSFAHARERFLAEIPKQPWQGNDEHTRGNMSVAWMIMVVHELFHKHMEKHVLPFEVIWNWFLIYLYDIDHKDMWTKTAVSRNPRTMSFQQNHKTLHTYLRDLAMRCLFFLNAGRFRDKQMVSELASSICDENPVFHVLYDIVSEKKSDMAAFGKLARDSKISTWNMCQVHVHHNVDMIVQMLCAHRLPYLAYRVEKLINGPRPNGCVDTSPFVCVVFPPNVTRHTVLQTVKMTRDDSYGALLDPKLTLVIPAATDRTYLLLTRDQLKATQYAHTLWFHFSSLQRRGRYLDGKMGKPYPVYALLTRNLLHENDLILRESIIALAGFIASRYMRRELVADTDSEAFELYRRLPDLMDVLPESTEHLLTLYNRAYANDRIGRAQKRPGVLPSNKSILAGLSAFFYLHSPHMTNHALLNDIQAYLKQPDIPHDIANDTCRLAKWIELCRVEIYEECSRSNSRDYDAEWNSYEFTRHFPKDDEDLIFTTYMLACDTRVPLTLRRDIIRNVVLAQEPQFPPSRKALYGYHEVDAKIPVGADKSRVKLTATTLWPRSYHTHTQARDAFTPEPGTKQPWIRFTKRPDTPSYNQTTERRLRTLGRLVRILELGLLFPIPQNPSTTDAATRAAITTRADITTKHLAAWPEYNIAKLVSEDDARISFALGPALSINSAFGLAKTMNIPNSEIHSHPTLLGENMSWMSGMIVPQPRLLQASVQKWVRAFRIQRSQNKIKLTKDALRQGSDDDEYTSDDSASDASGSSYASNSSLSSDPMANSDTSRSSDQNPLPTGPCKACNTPLVGGTAPRFERDCVARTAAMNSTEPIRAITTHDTHDGCTEHVTCRLFRDANNPQRPGIYKHIRRTCPTQIHDTAPRPQTAPTTTEGYTMTPWKDAASTVNMFTTLPSGKHRERRTLKRVTHSRGSSAPQAKRVRHSVREIAV